MKTSLSDSSLRDLAGRLAEANNAFAAIYTGETGKRQPVHTVYGGAHLFKSDSAARLGSLARRSLDQFAPDFLTFAKAIGLKGAEQLPDSIDEAGDLATLLESDPDQLKETSEAAWLAHSI